MVKQAPSLGRILAMVVFSFSCVGILLFLWVSFGGSLPLNAQGYVVRVELAPGVRVDEQRLARNFVSNSACGLCGKASLAALPRVPRLGQCAPLAFSAALDYVVIRVDQAAEGRRARPGETLLVAEALAEEVAKRALQGSVMGAPAAESTVTSKS